MHATDGYLVPTLIFFAAMVIVVPIARACRLSAVIGYLVAGIALGPSGFRVFTDTATINGLAEFGVVLLLFLVGLELRVATLVEMRRDIVGFGGLQVLLSLAAAAVVAVAFGLAWVPAIVLGYALAISATAVALQVLEERGERQEPYARRAFAALLFQDVSIGPVLALVPVVASLLGLGMARNVPPADALRAVAVALAATAAVIVVGRYVLNPVFRFLAARGTREVMTAAALLVVLSAAEAMKLVGLSMALGALLAGILLAESNFRHQLEADIEPFRGLLLGLFFMSAGMALDREVVVATWPWLLAAAAAVFVGKTAIAAGLLRFSGSSGADALRAAVLLAPAGEFSFVLLPLAASVGLLAPGVAAFAVALAAFTMLIGPIVARVVDLILARRSVAAELQEPDDFSEATGEVLVIGFGRFGQMVTQVLLASGADVTVIERDVERIRGAARFGFKVYYGDGTRLDVLRAAGAERARVVCVCVDDRADANLIVDLLHTEFPQAVTHVRAFDRTHAIELMEREVDYQLRETVESAIIFGRETVCALGFSSQHAAEIAADVRRRDVARLAMQRVDGLMSGLDLLNVRSAVTPQPLTEPKRATIALSKQTRALVRPADMAASEGAARDGAAKTGEPGGSAANGKASAPSASAPSERRESEGARAPS